MKTSHVINDQDILITLEIPIEEVRITNLAGQHAVGITMDDLAWHDAAKRVLRQQSVAEHDLDADVVADRSLREIRRALKHGAVSFAEPEVQRRRAVANVLQRIGDLVLSGTIQDLSVSWVREQHSILVGFQTGPIGRRRRREEVLPIEIPVTNADPAPRSAEQSSSAVEVGG